MKVLLDENLPQRLTAHVTGSVTRVVQQGWAGIKNGKLLRLAAAEFDVFVTMDRGIKYQQNITDLDLCVLTIRCRSNRLADLLPMINEINQTLDLSAPGIQLTVGT